MYFIYLFSNGELWEYNNLGVGFTINFIDPSLIFFCSEELRELTHRLGFLLLVL
jgi:hypothetical protein